MGWKIVFEKQFLKAVQGIPLNIQTKLANLIELLKINPYHPLLHTKQLTGNLSGLLSFRVTREWRVIFYFRDTETIQLLELAHRKEIYK